MEIYMDKAKIWNIPFLYPLSIDIKLPFNTQYYLLLIHNSE